MSTRLTNLQRTAALMVAFALTACGQNADPGPAADGQVVTEGTTAPARGFEGIWTAVDLDGSNEQLTVSGGDGGQLQVEWYDDNATLWCDDVPGTWSGSSTPEGDILRVTFRGTCESDPPTSSGPYEETFEYEPETDTLTDSFGVRWSRG